MQLGGVIKKRVGGWEAPKGVMDLLLGGLEKKDICFQGGWVGATKNPPALIMLGGNYKKI